MQKGTGPQVPFRFRPDEGANRSREARQQWRAAEARVLRSS